MPIELKCEGCGTAFYCSPAQASRRLGKLCRGCLETFHYFRPAGYAPPVPGEVMEEQQLRRSEFVPPTAWAPAEPPALSAVRQLLAHEAGMSCIPRFFRQQLWTIVRGERQDFLDRYLRRHLQLIEKFVLPFADEESGHPGFAAICQELEDAESLAYIGERWSSRVPDADDPASWLAMAVALEPRNPEKSLYCAANFLAVPPILGEVPPEVDGALRVLIASAVLEFGDPEKVAALLEDFLGLRQTNYANEESLRSAILRSPWTRLAPVPQVKLGDLLTDALRQLPQRGPTQSARLQTVLASVLARPK